MTAASYEISPYRSEWGQQVAELMVHLWDPDVEVNRAYLQWKYEGNPYAPEPLAFVALHEGKVVGFRGYSPLPFRTDGGADVVVLCPGDACVHPDHRLSGLSAQMGRAGMQAYDDRYRLFMNWSCSKASLPGYRKMGFFALVEKAYLTHAGALGTLRYLLALREAQPPASSRIDFGRKGAIEVAAAPRPAEMAALAAAEVPARGRPRPPGARVDSADADGGAGTRSGGRVDPADADGGAGAQGRLALRRDETFFTWRFANPRGRYVFYYLLRDGVLTGYAVFGLSPNHRRGFLLDFAEGAEGALAEIARFMLRAGHFDVVSVYTYCLSDRQRRALEKLGFSVSGLIPYLETQQKGRLPLFIRPVKETFDDRDFLIEGIDTRTLAAWALKPIGSDAM
jgi:GNAT superfamily N-acetyltransferase